MARVSAPILLSLLLLTSLLAGCASNVVAPGGSGIPSITARPEAEDRLHQQANDALERWASAVRDSGGASITFVGELTSQLGSWEDANARNKEALAAGLVDATTSLSQERPGRREVKWVDGKKIDVEVLSARQAFDQLIASAAGECADCESIRVTDANLATGLAETSNGPAEVPMWVYSVRGSSVRITRVAVDGSVTVDPPPWDVEDPPVGLSIDVAFGAADSRTLEVQYIGADDSCGMVTTVEAVESDLAVVVLVEERPGPDAKACRLKGVIRTAEVRLDAVLGNRVVLEGRQGLPVPVHAPE
jgi:hypothetical protein